MAVKIELVDGLEDGRFINAQHGESAYRVLDSGVLQLLANRGGRGGWEVDTEYGPAAWLKVSGTRFYQDTKNLPGLHGKAPDVSGSFIQQ